MRTPAFVVRGRGQVHLPVNKDVQKHYLPATSFAGIKYYIFIFSFAQSLCLYQNQITFDDRPSTEWNLYLGQYVRGFSNNPQ